MKLIRSTALLLLAALAGHTSHVAADNMLVTENTNASKVLVTKAPAIESSAPACALIKCSDQGDGVCGSDGVTYRNACQLTAAQCGQPGLHQVKDVCDATGVVYGNPCEFMQARCKDASLELAECPKSKCTLPHCAPIEKPVCASNGKTYMNRCLFSYFACKDPSLSVERDGECESSPEGEAPTGCATVLCPQFSQCLVDERTGRGYCADICDPKMCGEGETCVLKTVQCFTTPCPPIAECVKTRS